MGVRWRGPGLDGPWDEVVADLVEALDHGLADAASGMSFDGLIDGFEEYVSSTWLTTIVERRHLSDRQAEVVLGIAEDMRLFFDSTVRLGPGGLDDPIEGDLSYLCSFDYDIDVPSWASWRAS
jgi:hypothetical protein